MRYLSLRTPNRLPRLLLALSVLCCAPGCEPVPEEFKAFNGLPPQQQREQMERLPVDKQIDIFLAGQAYAHPPLRLGDYIARRGKEAVPPLVKRLKSEQSAARQVDILHVLEDMNKYYYNLKDEKEAIEEMRKVVAAMKDPLHRPRAEIAFEAIENQQMLIPRK